jgi:hypothetical protein
MLSIGSNVAWADQRESSRPPDKVLTEAAKAMARELAWGDNACFPGQLKLAENMGAGSGASEPISRSQECSSPGVCRQSGTGGTDSRQACP